MFKTPPAFSSFSVDDIDKATQFYGKTLGLETSEEYGTLNQKLTDGGRVMIYPKDNHQATTFTVMNFVVDDIEKTVDDLTQKGITFERYTSEIQTNEKGISSGEGPNAGPKMAWFKDPAGNIL